MTLPFTVDDRVVPPIRPEYDRPLLPLVAAPVARALPLATRVWQQGWLR